MAEILPIRRKTLYNKSIIFFLLENGRAVQLNKLESPSDNDALCQVWMKLPDWFLRKSLNLQLEIDRNYRILKKSSLEFDFLL